MSISAIHISLKSVTNTMKIDLRKEISPNLMPFYIFSANRCGYYLILRDALLP